MIKIIDYGMGNLMSVLKAFQFLDEKANITDRPDDLKEASRVVFPGVGAFGDAVDEIDSRGFRQAIQDFVATGKPFLGICLGQQLLLEESDETKGKKGLSFLKGGNKKFLADNRGEHFKVPQIGWNSVSILDDQNPLFQDIPDATYFYFVHSYFSVPEDTKSVIGQSEYSEVFPSALQSDNLFAVQFHPEKSQRLGLQLLKNFSEMAI